MDKPKLDAKLIQFMKDNKVKAAEIAAYFGVTIAAIQKFMKGHNPNTK